MMCLSYMSHTLILHDLVNISILGQSNAAPLVPVCSSILVRFNCYCCAIIIINLFFVANFQHPLGLFNLNLA